MLSWNEQPASKLNTNLAPHWDDPVLPDSNIPQVVLEKFKAVMHYNCKKTHIKIRNINIKI